MFYQFDIQETLDEMSETLISMGVAILGADFDDANAMVKLSDARLALYDGYDGEDIFVNRSHAEEVAAKIYVKNWRKAHKDENSPEDYILEDSMLWNLPLKELSITRNELTAMITTIIRRDKARVDAYKLERGMN